MSNWHIDIDTRTVGVCRGECTMSPKTPHFASAADAWAALNDPASQAQLKYLAYLATTREVPEDLLEVAREAWKFHAQLTVSDMGGVINQLLVCPEKEVHEETELGFTVDGARHMFAKMEKTGHTIDIWKVKRQAGGFCWFIRDAADETVVKGWAKTASAAQKAAIYKYETEVVGKCRKSSKTKTNAKAKVKSDYYEPAMLPNFDFAD